jgi:hypothetical protein
VPSLVEEAFGRCTLDKHDHFFRRSLGVHLIQHITCNTIEKIVGLELSEFTFVLDSSTNN